MADVNYVNPTAALPKTETMQVPAFMQGMQYNTQMTDYNDQMALSKLLSQMNYRREEEEMTQGAPVRQAKRLSDIATSNATAATIGGIKQNELNKGTLENQFTQATQPSRIATTIAENVVKQGEAGMKQLQNTMRLAQIAGQLQGPQAGAQISEIAQEMKLDPNSSIVKAIMQDPKKVTKLMMEVNETLQGDLAKQDNQAGHQLTQATNIANIQGKTARAVASIGAESRVQAASLKAQLSGQAQTIEKQISAIIAKQRALRAEGKELPKEDIDAYNTLAPLLQGLRSAGILQQQAGAAALGLPDTPAVTPPPIVPDPTQGNNFSNAAAAEAAIKAGKLKKGDYFMLNGQRKRVN